MNYTIPYLWAALNAKVKQINKSFSTFQDRNVVRRAILLHRISKSGSYDPYHSIDADKLRYKRQVGTFPSDDEDFLDGSGEDIVERDEEPTPPPDHPSPSTNDWSEFFCFSIFMTQMLDARYVFRQLG